MRRKEDESKQDGEWASAGKEGRRAERKTLTRERRGQRQRGLQPDAAGAWARGCVGVLLLRWFVVGEQEAVVDVWRVFSLRTRDVDLFEKNKIAAAQLLEGRYPTFMPYGVQKQRRIAGSRSH